MKKHLTKKVQTWPYDSFSQMIDRLHQLGPYFANSNHPADKIHIRPEPEFYEYDFKPIWLSDDYRSAASKTVTAEELGRLITGITQSPFSYTTQMKVDAQFDINNLPKLKDDINLHRFSFNLEDYLSDARETDALELRFLDKKIGFGVFSRCAIKKEQPVIVYKGLYTNQHTTWQYFFRDKDSFNLSVNAKHIGNLARFINHTVIETDMPHIQTTNLYSMHHNYYGFGIIVLYAKRDISPGEQLFYDYGKIAQSWARQYLFNHNNQLCNERGKPVRQSMQNNLINHCINNKVHFSHLRLIGLVSFFIICLVISMIINSI